MRLGFPSGPQRLERAKTTGHAPLQEASTDGPLFRPVRYFSVVTSPMTRLTSSG